MLDINPAALAPCFTCIV